MRRLRVLTALKRQLVMLASRVTRVQHQVQKEKAYLK